MEQHKQVLDKITQFSALQASEKRAAQCRRKKLEIARFEKDLGYNLCKLSYELANGKYKRSDYHTFYVREPKLREIQALKFRDRVVQNCICNEILQPFIEPKLIYDNGACRKGKGTDFARNRLTEFLRRYYVKHGSNGYVLKIDVAKYFASVDHEALKKRLRASKMPYDEYKLCCWIIDGYNADTGKGLPMGNQSSQWFALYYLDGLDRLIKEKYHIKYYTRYMDDMVLIHHDKEYLKEVLKGLREYATQELKVSFNSKTQITPLSQGVEYLGFRYYLTGSGKIVRKLKTSAKKRFKNRIKKLKSDFYEGKIDWENIRCSVNSLIAHMKHGHTYYLRKAVLHSAIFKVKKPESSLNNNDN